MVDKEIVFMADVGDGSTLLLVEFVAVQSVQDFIWPPQYKSRKPILQIQHIKPHDFADRGPVGFMVTPHFFIPPDP
jgi:hypothetical protein